MSIPVMVLVLGCCIVAIAIEAMSDSEEMADLRRRRAIRRLIRHPEEVNWWDCEETDLDRVVTLARAEGCSERAISRLIAHVQQPGWQEHARLLTAVREQWAERPTGEPNV